ncbi:hypothetical protein EJ04DRAFT_64712 [Polyplosphaeria fusca]|uniref:F-box domain-containing protein n=1 Tax=Polyplosphaeria fusca TaxID=682080 RepID=A0A9P4QQL0_9PLEO|nr:hypothetical protein EJ04DRAFT_64712 [Polyplosphaeria fusca]
MSIDEPDTEEPKEDEELEYARLAPDFTPESELSNGSQQFMTAYWELDNDPVYPMHEQCYRILARCLTGDDDLSKIQKHALYRTLNKDFVEENDMPSCLDVDYGDCPGREQFWMVIPGCEHNVADPSPRKKYTVALQDMLQVAPKCDSNASVLKLELKTRNDPFATFPNETVTMICERLPQIDLLNLISASGIVYTATRSNGFWRQKIRDDFSPWLWELEYLVRRVDYDNVDWRNLYHELDIQTAPRYGLRGPLVGLANRRRIWSVCEQIMSKYVLRKTPDGIDEVLGGGTFEELTLLDSRCLETWERPSAFKNWITDRAELQKAKAFETWWSGDDELVGLGVAFGEGDKRIFGRTKGAGDGIWVDSVDLQESEWVTGIVMHVGYSGAELEEDEEPVVGVEGVSLTLTSGRSFDLGNVSEKFEKRSFVPPSDRFIVGVCGKFLETGVLSHLSLLTAAIPS